MATETIRIIVSESGSNQAAANIRGVGKEATASAQAVDFLNHVLGALAVEEVIREYVKLSNEYQQIQNRIKLVTTSTQEQADVTAKLLQVANATLTPLEATAELYSRLAFNTRNLGLSQEQVLRITQTLNEATIVSGVNSREAKSAVIELTHGLAEGTLHGYQLRSILAQVPFVADLIAQHLHVSSDAIRTLGAQGKLTSQDLIEAFAAAAESTDQKFSKIKPTIGQAFTVLHNNLINAVGEFNKATGASDSLASVILYIADNIQTVGIVFQEVFKAISVTVHGAIDLIGVLFGTIDKAGNDTKLSFLNVATVIAAQIDALLGIFVGFGRALSEFFNTVFDNLKGLGERAINATISIFETGINGIIKGMNLAVAGIAASVNKIIDIANEVSDTVGGGKLFDNIQLGQFDEVKFKRLTETALTNAKDLGSNVATAFKQGFDSSNLAGTFLNNIVSAVAKAQARPALNLTGTVPGKSPGDTKADLEFQKLKEELTAQQDLLNLDQKRGQLQFDQQNSLIKLKKELQTANVHLSEDQTAELQALVKSNAERKIRNELDRQVRQLTTSLQDQINLLGLDTQQRAVQADLLRVTNAYKEAGLTIDQDTLDALKGQREELQLLQNEEAVVNGILGDRAKIAADLAAAQKAHDEGRLNDTQLQRFKLEQDIAGRAGDTSVMAGFENGLDRLQLKVTDFASLTEQTLTDAFSGAEDALVHFVQTGEFSFSSLVDSILADLTRLLARQAIAALINALGSGSSGGGVAGLLAGYVESQNGGARAVGGPVQSGRSYLVGERGPEIFNPNQNGSIVPNNQINQGGGGGGTTIVNVVDPNMISAALADPRNANIILNVIGNNRAAVRKQLGVT